MATDGFTMCLRFDGQAEEAANHYTTIFEDSGLGRVGRSTEADAAFAVIDRISHQDVGQP